MSRTDPDLKNVAHMEFANDLGVNILRVQGIGVEYDDQYLYISATLLDNPPPPGRPPLIAVANLRFFSGF